MHVQHGMTCALDRCLSEVVRSLRALKSLSLTNCVHLTDEGGCFGMCCTQHKDAKLCLPLLTKDRLHMVCVRFQPLVHLHSSNTPTHTDTHTCTHSTTHAGFIPIGQVSALTRVCLGGCVALGDLGVVLLAQLPALAELEIPFCFKVLNAGGWACARLVLVRACVCV